MIWSMELRNAGILNVELWEMKYDAWKYDMMINELLEMNH